MRIAPKRTIPLRKHNIKIIYLLYGALMNASSESDWLSRSEAYGFLKVD
jgi:hypothetical protein